MSKPRRTPALSHLASPAGRLRSGWKNLALALTCLGLSVALPAADAPDAPPAPPATAPAAAAISTATVEKGTLRQTYPVVGEFRAHLTANLGAQVSGRVLAVKVDVGDTVHAGDVVVQLDPVFFDLDIAQQEAARKSAAQRIVTEQKSQATAKLDIATAEVNLADAKLQLDRMKSLFEKPAGQTPSVPRKSYDDAITHEKQAEVAVQAAQARAAETDARIAEVTAALAPIDAALATAKQRRAEADVTVPFDAVVTRRLVSPGDSVTSAPATTLLELQDLAHIDLEFNVPQQFTERVRQGTVVYYAVGGVAGTFSGPIERILPLGDATSRTYRCRVLVDNRAGQFRPGLLVQVRLVQQEKTGVVIAPAAALKVTSTGWQVGLQKEGAFVPTPVEIGLRADDQVEIVKGLVAGDVVQVQAAPDRARAVVFRPSLLQEAPPLTLSDVAISRPVFTTMVILAIVVFGLVSYNDVGVDLFPRVELPVITVVTALPGADPETIENTVTDPIEESLSSISGIKHLRSVSTDGVSQVVLEFELEKKIDVAYQEVVAKIGAVHSQLPRDTEDPVVEKLDVDAAPVLALAISADHLPIQELTRVCDREIKERLQKVHNVGEVTLIGGRRRKIWLVLDRSKLAGFGLTVLDIEQALLTQHVELPGGRLDTGPVEMIVKTKAEFPTAEAMSKMVVAHRGDSDILLSQVGHVDDGMEEERSSARLKGKPAVSLLVQRQSGANTVEVAEAVKAEVTRLQKEYADRGIHMEVAQDLSVFIERSIEEVHFHILFGGGLAIIIVFLFLRNFRSTMISSLVIPTAVIGTFILMNVLGFTQNMMTLLALSLSIGLLIDDAIVVQENIMRHVEEGMPAREAASFGTREITLAVLATTLSVVAVFVPVAFMKGIVGRFFYQFGLTVTFAVLISMFVSFTLDPMLSSRILRAPKKGPIFRFSEHIFEFIEHIYEAILRFAMRFRFVIILIALGAFFAAGYVARFIKAEFLPTEDHSEFNISVRGPLGSTLDTTQSTLDTMRQRLEKQPWTDYTFATIGTGSLQRVNEGTLYVKMTAKESRRLTQDQAMAWVRDNMSDLQNVQLSVDQVQAVNNGTKNKQLMYEVRGSDFAELKRLSEELAAKMKATPGMVEVESSLEEGRPEIDIHVDRDKSADRGVDPAAIAATLNALIGGDNVAKFRAAGERYDIAVRVQEDQRNKIPDVGLVEVRGKNGTLVPLRDVARIDQTAGLLQIDRNDRARQITVMANLDPKLLVLGDALQKVEGFVKQLNLQPGYSVNAAGQAENFKESFGYLIFALLMAVVIVYMVLASQFESFVHPFTIMLSLPLSVVGALGALALFHMTMSIFTMIGIIMLMGLVTKNAILLVDYTNTLRHRDGMDRLAAILKAGPVRLRPILMTTLAMIFGMLPIALGTGSGSESRAPMAVAVIGGLTTSTLLTLVVVPVVYSLIDDFVHPTQWRVVRWLRKSPKAQ